MELMLSVVSYHRFTSDLEVKKSFFKSASSQSYSIGRSQQSDWYLPDHERVISGTHARIECHSHCFTITDVSTNGVFINRSVTPLGKENSHTLRDGDFLSFGDYELEVAVLKPQGDADPEREAPTKDDHELAAQFDDLNQTVPDAWDFGISTRQLQPTGMGSSNGLDSTVMAPSSTVSEPTTSQAASHAVAGNIEDSFIAPGKLESAFDEESETLAIPEDWSANLLREQENTQSTNEEIEPVPTAKSFDLQSDSVVSREDEHRLDDDISAKDYALNKTISDPAASPSDESALAMKAFIQGLGISHNMVPSDNDEQWWFELGTSMQYLMTGLMDSLHHRTAFKQNNRLNQTLFQRQENNPLKFSATLEDAIHNLFNRKSASFLPSDRAIKEAFSDIDNHEQALLAGVDGTVNGMMKLLSPESIVAKTQEQAFWGRRSATRSKAQNWANYEAMYKRLNDDLQSASNSFYLDDFVKAYELHLKTNKTKG